MVEIGLLADAELSLMSLCQVLLGEDKPIWLALIPGPDSTFFGALVRFDEKWQHSSARPSKSLVKKASTSLLFSPSLIHRPSSSSTENYVRSSFKLPTIEMHGTLTYAVLDAPRLVG